MVSISMRPVAANFVLPDHGFRPCEIFSRGFEIQEGPRPEWKGNGAFVVLSDKWPFNSVYLGSCRTWPQDPKSLAQQPDLPARLEIIESEIRHAGQAAGYLGMEAPKIGPIPVYVESPEWLPVARALVERYRPETETQNSALDLIAESFRSSARDYLP